MDLSILKRLLIEDLNEKKLNFKQSLQKKDFVQIAQIGHQLKGNSAALILKHPTLNELGRSIEKAAKEQNLNSLQTLFEKLSGYQLLKQS